MINKVHLYPYRNEQGKYLGIPNNFIMNKNTLKCITIDLNKINKVNEFDYNWLIVHPVVIKKQYQFEIV